MKKKITFVAVILTIIFTFPIQESFDITQGYCKIKGHFYKYVTAVTYTQICCDFFFHYVLKDLNEKR